MQKAKKESNWNGKQNGMETDIGTYRCANQNRFLSESCNLVSIGHRRSMYEDTQLGNII